MLDTFSICSEMARALLRCRIHFPIMGREKENEKENKFKCVKIVKRNSLNDFVKSLNWCRFFVSFGFNHRIDCHVRAEWQLNGLRIVKSFMINSLGLSPLCRAGVNWAELS